MKILQLRFKNLNSLAGEWTIDFTAPEYISDGIFAISGATGAGKSTIMDAICLALYGRTPRLKSISKSSNEIMSRHTGECFSEVVFETQKGQFRCTWSQHRGRRKATEELQNPSHEIADNLTGKIIESKLRAVAIAIEESTGMDFERFTQSMMLAQGGFAAFLQADPDQRAPILEEITGTEIYSEISKLVNERKRTEINKLDVLTAETKGITILNEEDEILLNNQLTEKIGIEAELNAQKNNLDSSILWLNGIESLKKELVGIEEENRIHTLKLKDFEADRLVLQKALQAAELDGIYASLIAKRKLQSDELGVLASSKEKVPELQTNVELAIRQHIEANNLLIEVKRNAEIERELIKKARNLDVTIKEKQLVLNRNQSEHKKTLENKILKIGEKKSLQNEIKAEQDKLVQIQNYLTANAVDSVLVTEMTGIKEKLNNLKVAKATYSTLEIQLLDAQKKLTQAEKELKEKENLVGDLIIKNTESQNEVTHSKQALIDLLGGRELREIRAEHTNLLKEMVYIRKIASLESERKQLEDEKPCPLCGSLHHPYALGNIPESDAIGQQIDSLAKLIGEAEKLETEIKICETNFNEAAKKLSDANTVLHLSKINKETCQIAVVNKQNDQKDAFDTFNGLMQKITDALQPFGLQITPDTDLEALSDQLNTRLKKWNDNQERQSEIQKILNRLSSSIDNINILIKESGNSLKLRLKEIIENRQGLEVLRNQRTEIFGLRNPDMEDKRISELISSTEKSEREASDKKNKLSQELTDLNKRIIELTESTTDRNIELTVDENSFQDSLQISGFENEAIFVKCKLPTVQREQLNRIAKDLDSKQSDIKTRKKDREERLLLEEVKKLTETPLADLLEEQIKTGDILISIREEIGGIKRQLEDNKNAKVRIGQLTMRIEAQKTECRRWEMLNNLIGSADGKKYRNFAQGLTFEIMISHANHQLMKLTDRYLLIRDKNQPLDLNVIDNYQAGEVRSTKNLSGGESFIVSLALALGLSKMASKKVRVDSLFLDEGFGTLDEDTLETALETLASLRQDGKLIGVISHVSALKERINAKIIVQKGSGGKSTIYGPGCSRLN